MKYGILLFLSVLFLGACKGQTLGTVYAQTDTLVITTTHRTVTPAVKWEAVVIYSDTVDWWLRLGASSVGVDTSSWSSRDPIRVPAGHYWNIGPGLKLSKYEMWTVTGTGTLFFYGFKKSSEF